LDINSKERATRPEQFNLLYQTIERYNERFVKASMAVTTALLVVLGWLLTANIAVDIFQDNLAATLAVLFVIAALIWVYSVSMCRVYAINHSVYEKLKALEYIEDEYYEHHRLPHVYKYFGLWVNIVIYLMLAIIVANTHWCIL